MVRDAINGGTHCALKPEMVVWPRVPGADLIREGGLFQTAPSYFHINLNCMDSIFGDKVWTGWIQR